ncbi:MAG TPA: hypothetical protein VF131_02385 [Blastocatellia bacterium]|nr:hypothetical protein [Blastocatellia bacterium]
MKSKNERANSAGMKVKSNVKAGAGCGIGCTYYNHNQTVARDYKSIC